MNELSIKSHQKTYPVSFFNDAAALLDRLLTIENAIAVIDQNVQSLYPTFAKQLSNQIPLISIEATEENKTLTGLQQVLDFLSQNNATKKTTLLAIGGGIIQDIVTFAAHLYYRGLSLVLIPTTLLAMCDSCIGSKSGLNYRDSKNQLGMFHAPEEIFIWPDFIRTLSKKDLTSGYGEICKFALITGEPFYSQIKASFANDHFNTTDTLSHIKQSLLVKKEFIEEDEYDQNVRKILNYGHTFGHALEAATQYAVPHGIAVTWGADLVNFIAWKKGYLAGKTYQEIHQFFSDAFFKDIPKQISPSLILEKAKKDKKGEAGKLTLVLLKDIGSPVVLSFTIDDTLKTLSEEYITQE